jgi:hypothetical protein
MELLRKLSQAVGAACVLGGLAWLGFTAAAPLGLVAAYPDPPPEVVVAPLGRTQTMPPIDDLYRKVGEADGDYFKRLVHETSSAFVHYWPTDNQSLVGVSPLDNWIMWYLGRRGGDFAVFREYEFSSPEKALARGYGFCSQISYAIYMILRDQGYDAHVLMHPNHVVVEVAGHILDGDFGVVLPHSSNWLQAHPAAAARHYEGSRILYDIYAAGWQTRTDHMAFDRYRRFERVFDAMKWLPGWLLLTFGALTISAHRPTSGRSVVDVCRSSIQPSSGLAEPGDTALSA